PGRFGERRNASASMVHASHAAYAAPAEWIAGHPNSPFPALKASFNITLKYALAALRRRYAKLRGGQAPRSA
ncbi:hypothetical protein ACIKTA_09460, partial [Hansschlegelia beijingensis]